MRSTSSTKRSEKCAQRYKNFGISPRTAEPDFRALRPNHRAPLPDSCTAGLDQCAARRSGISVRCGSRLARKTGRGLRCGCTLSSVLLLPRPTGRRLFSIFLQQAVKVGIRLIAKVAPAPGEFFPAAIQTIRPQVILRISRGCCESHMQTT